jgi:hypothetical protein
MKDRNIWFGTTLFAFGWIVGNVSPMKLAQADASLANPINQIIVELKTMNSTMKDMKDKCK